jgi:hypothetical protein
MLSDTASPKTENATASQPQEEKDEKVEGGTDQVVLAVNPAQKTERVQ